MKQANRQNAARRGATNRDSGVVLINVLIALALGAAIVVLMFTSQEPVLEQTQRLANSTQAEALALAGEASMVTALRRDMADAPEADHYAEAWALAAQESVVLETGRYSVDVEDVQGRLNLNQLAGTGLAQQLILARLVTALELPESVVTDIRTKILRNGPQRDLRSFDMLSDEVRAALAPHVSLLPISGNVNVNTAGPLVLGAVLGSPRATAELLKRRQENGFLTLEDVQSTGVISLNGAGFKSNVYDVTASAEVDGSTVTLRSRIVRELQLGEGRTVVISRQFGPASQARPTLPARF